jgi:hypothetical protein
MIKFEVVDKKLQADNVIALNVLKNSSYIRKSTGRVTNRHRS